MAVEMRRIQLGILEKNWAECEVQFHKPQKTTVSKDLAEELPSSSSNQNNWRFLWKWPFWYAQVFCRYRFFFFLFSFSIVTLLRLYLFSEAKRGGFICGFLMRHGDVLANFSCQGENKIEAASAKTAKASAKPKGETEGETKKGVR